MRGIGDNKRGQQMTLGTIILMVLGIAVLALLIFGFSTGWKNMWDRVTIYGGGSANLGAIKQSCDVACSANDKYSFCSTNRSVKFGESIAIKGDCTASTTPTMNNCYATCNNLSKSNVAPKAQAIGVLPCPSITC